MILCSFCNWRRQQWVQSSHLTMAYREIQVYFIIKDTYNLVVSKILSRKVVTILRNTKLVKPNDLLKILNQVNPKVEFTMERSTANLLFLDIMTNETGTKFWVGIAIKQAYWFKKLFAFFIKSFTSSAFYNCNIPFCLVWRICTIVEEEATKLKRFSELKILLKQQKHPIALTENSIKRNLQIPLTKLKKPKEKITKEITTLLSTQNSDNPNIFQIIR